MITKKKIIASIIGLCIALSAYSKGFKKTKNGVQYKIHTHGKEKKISMNDIIQFHYTMKNDKDSVIDESYKVSSQPLTIKMDSIFMKEAFAEGLLLLSKGDSATFIFLADSLFKNSNSTMPPSIKKGSSILLIIKIYDVTTKEKQKRMDDQLIQDYLKKENLKAEKTASGLYYIIEKKGTGGKPNSGDVVKANYTGKLLNGTTFDSNTDPLFDHLTPFEFTVGIGQVISGWDEGFLLLNEGTKAKFFIPSELAYGSRQAGHLIKPNSVLLFDVELLEITRK